MLKMLSAAAAILVLAAGPALAAPVITATLQKPVAAPASKVVDSVILRCLGDACASTSDVSGANAKSVCRQLVKEFGPVSAFSSAKGAMTADELAACNK